MISWCSKYWYIALLNISVTVINSPWQFWLLGHADSWELGHPGLLTRCNTAVNVDEENDIAGNSLPIYGPMNPIKEAVYTFLKKFFKEISTVFPDKLIHLGGDEVGTSCW